MLFRISSALLSWQEILAMIFFFLIVGRKFSLLILWLVKEVEVSIQLY